MAVHQFRENFGNLPPIKMKPLAMAIAIMLWLGCVATRTATVDGYALPPILEAQGSDILDLKTGQKPK